MKSTIQARFSANLDRISSLVTLYQTLRGGTAGRPATSASDILRFAVVLSHAALEDLLRDILLWKLPSAAQETLSTIPLAGLQAGKKFDLGEFARFRGQMVDDVIRTSVHASLLQSNYNSVGQVLSALASVSLAVSIANVDKASLTAMMKRRHWIVHRLDSNSLRGSGHHITQSLSSDSATKWLDLVRRVGQSIVDVL